MVDSRNSVVYLTRSRVSRAGPGPMGNWKTRDSENKSTSITGGERDRSRALFLEWKGDVVGADKCEPSKFVRGWSGVEWARARDITADTSAIPRPAADTKSSHRVSRPPTPLPPVLRYCIMLPLPSPLLWVSQFLNLTWYAWYSRE